MTRSAERRRRRHGRFRDQNGRPDRERRRDKLEPYRRAADPAIGPAINADAFQELRPIGGTQLPRLQKPADAHEHESVEIVAPHGQRFQGAQPELHRRDIEREIDEQQNTNAKRHPKKGTGSAPINHPTPARTKKATTASALIAYCSHPVKWRRSFNRQSQAPTRPHAGAFNPALSSTQHRGPSYRPLSTGVVNGTPLIAVFHRRRQA